MKDVNNIEKNNISLGQITHICGDKKVFILISLFISLILGTPLTFAQANVTTSYNSTNYSVDTAGNINSSTVSFTIDTIPPNITIHSPENKTYTTDSIDLNVTIDEPSSITYTWDGEDSITGCQNCTSYSTTYDEYANASEQNLVGLWHFNENYSTISTDDSDNGNDGTITGAAWTAGKFGNALSFDGNDYVNVTRSSTFDESINSTGKMAIIIWLKPIYPMAAMGSAYSRNTYPDESLRFITANESGQYYHSVIFNTTCGQKRHWLDPSLPQNRLINNSWNFWAWTYNGSTSRIYLNGSLIGTKDIGNCPMALDDNYPLYIGSYAPGKPWAQNFNGTIDEVAIFDRALSADEIQDLYNKKLSDGQHNITVYAGDTYGNINISTVYFTFNISSRQAQSNPFIKDLPIYTNSSVIGIGNYSDINGDYEFNSSCNFQKNGQIIYSCSNVITLYDGESNHPTVVDDIANHDGTPPTLL